MSSTDMKYLKTSQIARAVGLHPNTIRMYEELGLLPSISRGSNGYRLYTQMHLEQVRLIRLSLQCTFFGGSIRLQALDVMHTSAKGDIDAALLITEQLIGSILVEHRQAEDAEKFLEAWASGGSGNPSGCSAAAAEDKSAGTCCETLRIHEAAKLLDVTADMLRDWERNRLIAIPRNHKNGYRQYGSEEINKLRVIRLLRRSRYGNMSILRVMQQLDAGETGNLREYINTPDFDEERGYLCFTDNLLSSLENAKNSAYKMIDQLNHMKQIQLQIQNS